MLLFKHYPCLFLSTLEYMDKPKEIEDYKAYCLGFKENHNEYSSYCHGYLLPKLQELRKAGKLREGQRNVRDAKGWWYKYSGELDEEGQACGLGVASYDNGREGRIVGTTELAGTFFNNTFEGIGKYGMLNVSV